MKINIIKSLAIGTALFALPGMAFATTTVTSTNPSIQSLLDQIKNLQTQIETLRAAQTNMQSAAQQVGDTLKLIKNLREGMAGDDVSTLQAVLAADPEIYPEGMITGFYGRLTSEAVKKFQKKNGIEMVGAVGPKTLAKLNEHMAKLNLYRNATSTNATSSAKFCVKVPPGHMIAPGWLKQDREDGDDRGGENRGKGKGIGQMMQIVPECQNLPYGIEKKIGDDDWKRGTTTPDTVAPVISNIDITAGGSTTTIKWKTSEPTTGKLVFGTSTPVSTVYGKILSSSSWKTEHQITISDLSTSTTYYFVIGVQDKALHMSTTSQSSFTTSGQ